MLTQADRNRIAVNLWTARIIPLVLAGVIGYATYVTVALLCVNYLLVKHDDKAAAIPILVIYFMLFIPMTITFIRLFHITISDPPYVPLGAAALRQRREYKKNKQLKVQPALGDKGIGSGEYNASGTSEDVASEQQEPNNDPDSPGLELFYTKDVFIAEVDGRPIWCSQCSNWKPDRAHHDSSSGRCIRKMDHFCPWVGGPVGENNYKFFIQFTGYTTLYCLHLVVAMAIYIRQQITTEGEHANPQFCSILGLAAFFGLFTAGLTGTSLDLAASNATQVERLGGKTKVHLLAVIKPTREILRQNTPLFAPEVAYREITYPLDPGWKPPNFTPEHLAQSSIARQLATDPKVQSPNLLTTNTDGGGGPSLSIPSKQTVAQSMADAHCTEPKPFQPVATSQPGHVQLLPITTKVSNTAPVATIQPNQSEPVAERTAEFVSDRDHSATRTFAVLKLQSGDNPWDLGSARLNLQTVMGNGIMDWLLPIRRSPCCNHESGESQFKLGPTVDFARVSSYFMTPDEIQLPKKTKRVAERMSREKEEQRKSRQAAHDPALNGSNAVPLRDISHATR